MGMTMTQKILANAAGKESVKAGELIMANLNLVLGNDITTPVAIGEFDKIGLDGVFDKAKVALVPDHFTPNKDIKSAQQALKVRTFAKEQDIIVKAAAVADYRPASVAEEKIKKSDREASIELERTQDILAALGADKGKTILCGFSMETEHMLENSRKKLRKKNVDLIAANNLKVEGAGFGTDTNVLTLITEDGERELARMSKEEAADELLTELLIISKGRAKGQ